MTHCRFKSWILHRCSGALDSATGELSVGWRLRRMRSRAATTAIAMVGFRAKRGARRAGPDPKAGPAVRAIEIVAIDLRESFGPYRAS